ncbi:hypothetical protein BH10PSE2_BH10PSE2_24480 [soil metagenome]
MARRSRIVPPRASALSSAHGWRPVGLVAILAMTLVVLGQCSGRTVDLRAEAHGDAVTVDGRGATNWSQFFACYPVADGFLKVAIMRQYSNGADAKSPPERVRIPLDAAAGTMTQAEAGWLSGLRAGPATCPTSSGVTLPG